MKKILINVYWLYFYRVLRLSLAFFITAWVARYLGAENYGLYIFALAITEILMLFWTQGLKEVIIVELKENQHSSKIVFSAFYLLLTGNIILFGVLTAFLFFFIDNTQVVLVSLICGLGIIFRAFESFELWFYSKLKAKVTVMVQLIAQLCFMSFNIYSILTGKPLLWFAFGYSIQLLFAGVGFYIAYVSLSDYSPSAVSVMYMKKILKVGIYLLLAKLALTTSYFIDRILIEHFLGSEQMGYYSAAMKMITTWTFVSSAIAISYLPTFNTDQEGFVSHYRTMFGYITMISVVLAVPFFFLSPFLVTLIFGIGYLDSIPVFKILCFALPLILLNEGLKAVLIAQGQSKYFIGSMALITILICVLNYISIPIYGLKGAAFSFSIAWLMGVILFYSMFKETRPLFRDIMASFVFPIIYLKNKYRASV